MLTYSSAFGSPIFQRHPFCVAKNTRKPHISSHVAFTTHGGALNLLLFNPASSWDPLCFLIFSGCMILLHIYVINNLGKKGRGLYIKVGGEWGFWVITHYKLGSVVVCAIGMGRQPCCDKLGVKKGPWTAEEDKKLINFILTNGQCCWRAVPKLAGLRRCGKSCRLRWTNYLRPDLKRGLLTQAEEQLVIDLHARLGNRYFIFHNALPSLSQ